MPTLLWLNFYAPRIAKRVGQMLFVKKYTIWTDDDFSTSNIFFASWDGSKWLGLHFDSFKIYIIHVTNGYWSHESTSQQRRNDGIRIESCFIDFRIMILVLVLRFGKSCNFVRSRVILKNTWVTDLLLIKIHLKFALTLEGFDCTEVLRSYINRWIEERCLKSST